MKSEFYQAHLDRVSRSFAFCIAQLDGGLREYVGLSYLLCRVLDTIEDATWLSFDLQERAFNDFEHFIKVLPEVSEVEIWVDLFPKNLPEGEVMLIRDAAKLFSDFHSLPEDLHATLERSILSMSGGMRHYMKQKAHHGRLVLESAADVNRYCFFVAGVVGEMLTRFIVREIQPPLSRLRDAFRFGFFLQKVNLLKDQAGDENQGRYLVPSRSIVLSGLKKDADAALRFLLALPERDVGFRLFCAWSLFLGLASLPWLSLQSAQGERLKIPREETLRLLGEVESRISDNQALEVLFEKMKPGIEPVVENPSMIAAGGEAVDRELLALYRGELPQQDVLNLFRQS